jgi:hypothetical protein
VQHEQAGRRNPLATGVLGNSRTIAMLSRATSARKAFV